MKRELIEASRRTDDSVHDGSRFTELMEKDDLREDAEAIAWKRVTDWKLRQAAKKK